MLRDLKLDVFYPYSPERVWQAIANRRALAAWLMENDFEPVNQRMPFQPRYQEFENFDEVTFKFYISGGWHSAINSRLKKTLTDIAEKGRLTSVASNVQTDSW